MKLIAKFTVLLFCSALLFAGCDQEMTRPVMNVVSPPMDESLPPQSFIERARGAMQNVNQKRVEAQQKAEKTGDYLNIFIASEDIFREELGFRNGFWVELVDIYKDEKSDDSEVVDGFTKLQDAFTTKLQDDTLGMFYFEYIRTFDPLIVEYLRLSYVYPNMQEASLLMRFRGSVSDGKVLITFPIDF